MAGKLIFKSEIGGEFCPERATSGSAGFDLYSPEDFRLQAGEVKAVDLKLKHQPPVGYVGVLFARSGKAFKNNVRLFFEGLIDNDYRGSISILLENRGTGAVQFHRGDRLAQIVYLKYFTGGAHHGEVSETKRGEGGFGHTGR